MSKRITVLSEASAPRFRSLSGLAALPRLSQAQPPSISHARSVQSQRDSPSPRQHISTTKFFSSRPSPGTAATEAALAPLLPAGGGRWTLTADGRALERTFKFKTFTKTWDFMTAVSLQCKLKNHHPEWSNAFNTTFIRWTTHNPKGLSSKDLDLAAICDSLARDYGELVDDSTACGPSDLVSKATTASGDCCTPK